MFSMIMDVLTCNPQDIPCADNVKTLTNIFTASISVLGAFVVTIMTLMGICMRIRFERKLRDRDEISKADALEEEIKHRLHDVTWIYDELELALLHHGTSLPEHICDAILDEATVASVNRVQSFIERAWPSLDKVAAKRRGDLAKHIGSLETAIENIYGLLNRAKSTCTKIDEVAKFGNSDAAIRTTYLNYHKALVEALQTCVSRATKLMKKTVPGAQFGHEILPIEERERRKLYG